MLIRFGEFEIDTAALELRRNGEATGASPKAVRALIVLVENAGRLVTRDELYTALWPEPDVDVDRGLNTLIRQVRIALGDDASDPTFIRTYPRRGYIFQVRVDDADRLDSDGLDHEAAPAAAAVNGLSHRSRRLAMSLGVAGVALAVVVAFALAGRHTDRRTGSGGDIDSSILAAADLDPAVAERFLEGVYLARHPSPTRRAEAVEPLEGVIVAAPAFAPGHAWLADALYWAGRLEDARAEAGRALALDAGQERALIVRGTVRLVVDWDVPAAEADLREAVRRAADDPATHHALAFALAASGQHDEAVRELDEAYRLDPVSAVVAGDLGLIHLYAGNLDQAADYCERAASLEPDAAWAVQCAFDALTATARLDRARPLAARLVEWGGDSPLQVLGGDEVSDAEIVRRYREWRAERARRWLRSGGAPWNAALALAGAGYTAEAVHALALAAADRSVGFVTITIDPRFQPLWADAGFRRLAADLAANGFAPLPS